MIFTLISLSGCSPTSETPAKKPIVAPTQTPTPTNPQTHDSYELPVIIPAPTPQPEINEDWNDLPELPIAKPDPIIHTPPEPTPASGQSGTSAPNATFPSLPMSNAIWSAGILNGSPSGKEEEEISPEEYNIQERTDYVLHISDPTDLPPSILPDQRLVLHLPGIPKGTYRVNVAITGGGPETIKEEYLDREKFQQRHFTVRWNDHLLWQRWLPPIFFITQSAIPHSLLSSESNLLVLENSGTIPLSLDAVWVDPIPDTGVPFYVSLEDAQWLNQNDSRWVRNTKLTLPLPTVDTAWGVPANFVGIGPPLTSAELPEHWRKILGRYQLLMTASPELASAFKPWMHKAEQAVSRGMMPSIEIRRGDDSSFSSETFKAAVFLFGGLFHSWYLPGELATAENIEFLRNLSPGIQLISTTGSRTELDAYTMVRYPLSFNGLLTEHAQKYRKYFDGVLDQDALKTSLADPLTLKALFRGYNWYKQAFHSDEFFSAAGDYLMVNDQPLIVHGGFPGSPFFPAGDDTPGLMWHYLKPLFRFGGPDHHKNIANLTSDTPGSGIGRTTWAVASNEVNSVQVLVRNHIGLNDRGVNLELSVPWTGPTRILHHSVRSAWSTTETPKIQLERRTVEATGTDATGWIKIPFKLQGIQVFELSPEGSSFPRQIQAPEKVGFAELREVDSLFNVSRFAPPPWWSSMPMGAHFFAYWRFSGNVTLNVDVGATRDGSPDWAPFQDIHNPIPDDVKAVSPLRDTSTKFHFGDPIENVAQVLRAGYNQSSTYKGEIMGMWIRANPAPGFKRKFDAFNAVPRTQFYMGKLPYRQLIDVEYGRWYFITSKADFWRHSISKYSPYMVFWPANPEDGNPIIEVNSFEMYQVKIADTDITPEKCLGFIQEDNNGKLQVLVLGVPGKPAFWRQRLPNLVDVSQLTHTVDRELLTTADTPEEDPPERVRHHVKLLEDSKILEIEIEKMPAPPSPSHLQKIEKAYPLLRDVVTKRGLGVFLMEMQEPKE